MIQEATTLNIKEAFFLNGFSSIRVRPLGDNLALLSACEDENMKDVISKNR